MSDTLTMSETEILDQIKSEVSSNKVFVFMKGTPEMPRCGFSNQVVQILNHLGVEYGARDVLTDPNDAAIACTIVTLAQSLGLDVVAEGVETEGQREFLLRNGCHQFQGYLFGRPVPADQLLTLLKS